MGGSTGLKAEGKQNPMIMMRWKRVRVDSRCLAPFSVLIPTYVNRISMKKLLLR